MARTLSKSCYPFFLHSISVGLVPPFSEFFYAILEHYQVHVLHIQPRSIFVMSLFAFYCEAFVRLMPSVVMLGHSTVIRGQPQLGEATPRRWLSPWRCVLRVVFLLGVHTTLTTRFAAATRR